MMGADSLISEKLKVFRRAGIQVSLDDFGTGFSSVSCLKKFDINYLKIDQPFVRNLVDDPDAQAVCEAIIVMAHQLGLKVIAEGVEMFEQRDLLEEVRCDYGQGFLFSKPVAFSEFEQLLNNQEAAQLAQGSAHVRLPPQLNNMPKPVVPGKRALQHRKPKTADSKHSR